MRTRFFYLSVILLTFNIILTQNSIKADAGEWASNNKIPHSSNLSQNKYYPVTGATGDNQLRDASDASVLIGLGALDEEGNSIEILIDTQEDIGGFQFNIESVGSVTNASGGLAAQYGFMTSTGGNMVLGFSLSGTVIPAGSSGILTNCSFTDLSGEDICLSGVVI